MSYNDDYRDGGMNGRVDVSTMAPMDGDDERKTGAEREDASGWDQLSDTQRKLIALGIMLGIVVLLVLLLTLGSSCSCGVCSGCADNAAASASDVDESSRLPDEPSYIVEDISDSDVSSGDEAPGEELPADKVSDADISASDLPDDGVEYVEVVRPGGLSACSHQADNEAGGGGSTSNGGFLGFLFGCSGCNEGCNIDVSSSLTDGDYDDPNRLDGMNVSGSDTDSGMWEAQPDDDAYLEMLRGQLAVISGQIVQLTELDTALAPYTDPQRVRENDRFRKLTDSMLQWCDAAEGYDATLLTGNCAVACNMLSVRLAGDLRRYIEDYPLLITGATSGTDVVPKGDQLNAIMGDIVELYAVLNPATTPTTAPADVTEALPE